MPVTREEILNAALGPPETDRLDSGTIQVIALVHARRRSGYWRHRRQKKGMQLFSAA